MPLASLPGPLPRQWHIGPLPVHGYALCVALGVAAALWIAERRYRALGGRPWLLVDLATIVIPAAVAGAWLYRIATNFGRYFGAGSDWVNIARIGEGGLGLPGAAAGAVLAAVIWCRRSGTGIGPVLSAAVPGVAFGLAIAVIGNWFAQSMYGAPSSLPWAVQIAPRYRVPGYQNYGTFQPLFGYDALWDAAVGVLAIRLIRVRRLTGEQALALGAGLCALARLGIASLLLNGPGREPDLLADHLIAVAVVLGMAGYLFVTRRQHGPQPLTAVPRRRPPQAGGREDGLPGDGAPGAPGGIRTHT